MGAGRQSADLSPIHGRCAMKFTRILARIALVSLAAAVLAMLTASYGNSVPAPPRDLLGEIAREHRPASPDFTDSITILGQCVVLALYALIGRIVFRLRLSSPSRNEGKLEPLELHRNAGER
jgi:hypothetical protein